MLKTICVLCCGVGLAALGYGQSNDPVYYWTWSAEHGEQKSANGWSEPFTYTQNNDYAEFGTNGKCPYNTNISGIGPAFTISFDVRNLSQEVTVGSAERDLLSLSGSSDNNNIIKLKFTGSDGENSGGALVLYTNNYGGQTLTGSAPTSVSIDSLHDATEWVNLCLVSAPGENDGTLTIYVDGQQAGQITGWNPTVNMQRAQFGSELNGQFKLEGTIQTNNIYFYNAALPPSPVPEPAVTLLAACATLAGLSVRRKRI